MTATAPTRLSLPAALALAALGAGTLASCGGLDPVGTYQQITDPAQLYTALTIDHPAVNLSTVAPYDTLQLTATPRNALGEPLPGLPAPVFHLKTDADSTKVTVTPDGLLQAKAAVSASSPVVVLAELAVPGGSRFIDSTKVTVITTAPPPIASLSIQPVPPDSAIRSMLYNYGGDVSLLYFYNKLRYVQLPALRVLDAGGNPVAGTNLVLHYTSLAPTLADVDPIQSYPTASQIVQIWGWTPGQVGFVVRATVYGVPMADTLFVTITWPVIKSVTTGLTLAGGGTVTVPVFQPSEVRIAPYGMVLWENALDAAVDVTFEDPTNVVDPATAPAGSAPALTCDALLKTVFGPGPHCGAGNVLIPENPMTGKRVPDLEATFQVRWFPVPGIYRYHSTLTGATGRIVVTSDPDPTALP